MIATINFGCFDNHVWVRVTGRGDMHSSICLNQFVLSMLEKGYCIFILDLYECTYVDSTFMGTLLSLLKQVKNKELGSFKAINVTQKIFDLFENIGLNLFLTVDVLMDTPVLPPLKSNTLQSFDFLPEKKDLERKTVLKAHETLIAIDSKNEKKFRDVIEFLKKKDNK